VQLAGAAERDVESLGMVAHRRYLARVPKLLRAAGKVRRAAREADVLYCFGPDMLLLAQLAVRGLRRRPLLVYEVGDVREVFVGDGPRAWAARALERRALRGLSMLVVTSDAYLRGYYYPLQGLQEVPYTIIEPKVDPTELPETPAPDWKPWDGRLRIVYYGWMCCARSWETLRRLAREGGDRVEIRLRGILWADLAGIGEEVERLPNVHYEGPFRNPEELPQLFEGMDLAWVAHCDLLPNVLWARSSRFFNAGFFWKPMVAQRRTEDGARVEAADLGPVLELTDPEDSVRRLLAITPDDMTRWRESLRRTPRTTFAFSTEHARLLEAFRALPGLPAPAAPRVRTKLSRSRAGRSVS
jgi:succinoglycan biosynthesis protein ExoL